MLSNPFVMKKNRLVVGAMLLTLVLSMSNLSVGLCTSASDDAYTLEVARKLGPEKMIKWSFGKFLRKEDYTNPESVYIVRQYIRDELYPGDQVAFRTAVCTLGKCLEEDERYTKKQADKVVKFMLNFKPSAK